LAQCRARIAGRRPAFEDAKAEKLLSFRRFHATENIVALHMPVRKQLEAV
jgi:hypothetical protein